MPTLNNYMNFVYVNLGFIAQIALMFYFTSVVDIKKNWPLYRCNPPYWVFSDDITADFTYCVQNTQVNMMGYLLQPITYLISSLGNMGNESSNSINSARSMLSVIRGFITNITQSIFGVFLNLVTEFQRMTISIKDMVGKTVGIVVTLLYVLDGSVKTMESAWGGPPGQMVRAMGNVCFHPDTKLKLKEGKVVAMKDISLGAILECGSKVYSVLKVDNTDPIYKEDLYKIKGGVDNEYIYVTGSHFIYDEEKYAFVKVKNYKYAEKQTEVKSEWYSCLITNTGTIQIGRRKFWDWEDDVLNNN